MLEGMGRKDVTMTKFLDTGEHRYLPPALRSQREMALNLVKVYVNGAQAATCGRPRLESISPSPSVA